MRGIRSFNAAPGWLSAFNRIVQFKNLIICPQRKATKASQAISRVEPVLESNLEALEHLFFDVFDVSELAPPSHITLFRRALNLYDKLFHQSQLVRVFFPEMLFASVRSLFLPVLSPQTHRRLKLAVVNDCRDVSPLFRWQAYYRRQHLSSHLGVAVRCPHPKRPPDLMRDLQRLHSRIAIGSDLFGAIGAAISGL